MIELSASHFIHLVATVVWIGGLTLMTILVFPISRAYLSKQDTNGVLFEFLDRLNRRFLPLTNLSLIALTATGLYQMARDPNYDGLLQFTNDWSRAILLKHIAVLGMLIVGGIMQWSVLPALDRAGFLAKQGKADTAADVDRLRRRQNQLTVANFILGMLVLLFTAVATAA